MQKNPYIMMLPPAPKPILFEFTTELKEWQEELAQGTFNQPGNKQSLEQKRRQALSAVFLEHALVLQGATKNPSKFLLKDRYSYCWDVEWYKFITEVKRCAMNERTNWFTFYPEQVKTMCNSLHIVELLIVGDYRILPDNMVSVHWLLMTNPQNFKNNMNKCKIRSAEDIKENKQQYYYNHHNSETILIKDCTNLVKLLDIINNVWRT